MTPTEHIERHRIAGGRLMVWMKKGWGQAADNLLPPHLPSPVDPLAPKAAPKPKVTGATVSSAALTPPPRPTAKPPAPKPPEPAAPVEAFVPQRPRTLQEAGLEAGMVDNMIWKTLYLSGTLSARQLSEALCLHKGIIVDHVNQMKKATLVVYTGQTGLADFDITLTEAGRERARKAFEESSYVGACPVPLREYIASIATQSITREKPNMEKVRSAFSDLLISNRMFEILGPALNSGRGMFLYGFPGNGKTSIAERITRSFGEDVWIPKTLICDGIIIKLFDMQSHEPVNIPEDLEYDDRWIKIQRPTIIVGGELIMDNLEIRWDPDTRICEAPLQLKSNCGTLVIDDFGRQKMNPDQLLNRWIVPLEKRFDYLSMPTGKKIQVPFDQLIIFSTNLEPRDLVDDAFLRRIPYKINVPDPSEDEFRKLFEMMCPKLGFAHDAAMIDYLINTHYWRDGRQVRPYRCCHPRDLLMQIRNYCSFNNLPLELREDYFDFACNVYFTVLG